MALSTVTERAAKLAALDLKLGLGGWESKPVAVTIAKAPQPRRPVNQAAAAERTARLAQLSNRLEGKGSKPTTPGAAAERSLQTLVSMLRAGQLAPEELTMPGCIACRMLESSRKTAAEVLRLAGKAPSTPSPAAANLANRERRIVRSGEQR